MGGYPPPSSIFKKGGGQTFSPHPGIFRPWDFQNQSKSIHFWSPAASFFLYQSKSIHFGLGWPGWLGWLGSLG